MAIPTVEPAIDPIKVKQALVQREAELEIINSVQAGLARKFDFQTIVDLVGDKIREIFGAQLVGIMLLDRRLNVEAYPYLYEKGRRIQVEPIPHDERGFGPQAMRTRQPVLINSDMPGRMAEVGSYTLGDNQAGLTQSQIYAPLLAGDTAVGVVTIGDFDRENLYGDADVRLLTTLANAMSVALENARLFDETQRLLKETEQRAAELQIINSVQEGLASKLEMQAIYNLVGDKIREIFDAQSILIVMIDARRRLRHGAYGWEKGQRLSIGDQPFNPLTEHLIATKQPLVINENAQEAFAKFGMVVTPGTEAMRSGVFVPLIAGQEVTGFVSLQNVDRENAFRDSDVRLLQTLANSLSVALENARLFEQEQRLLEQTEQRAAELQIINSVQAGLGSKLEMQAIYDLVGDKIRGIFDAQAMVIATFDLSDHTEQLKYGVEKGERVHDTPGPMTAFEEHLSRTGQVVLINQDMEHRGPELGMQIVPGTQSAASGVWVPLVAGGAVFGLISLQNVERENAFSEADMRLLTTLANSLSVALENARLFDETQRLLKETEQRNAELAIINSIQGALAAKLDIQAIYDAVGDKISGIFPHANVGIRIYDATTNLIHFPYAMERGKRLQIDAIPRTAAGIANHVFETRQSLLINEDAEAESTKYGSYTLPGTESDRSALYVPLLVGDQARGLINLTDLDRENAFSESDVRLLTTIANSMSVALENARLFDETQRLFQAEQQRATELQIINSVQQGLAAELDFQAIVDLVGDKLRQVFHTPDLSISWYDEDSKLLHYLYTYEHGERIHVASQPPRPGGRFETMASSRLPLLFQTLADYEKFNALAIAGTDQSKSLISVPVISSDRLLGVITIENYEREDAYGESDLRLLTTIAASLGTALENARLFQEVQKKNVEISEALEQQTATSEILRVIARSPTEIKPVLDAVAQHAARLCEADDVQIYQVDGDQLRQVTHFGPLPALQDGESLPLVPGLVTGRAVLERRTIHVEDAERLASSEYPESVTLQQRLGHRTALSTPMLQEGRAIGAIVVRRNAVQPFSEKQIGLLSTFADQAAIAIENVRLFNETTRLLKETEQRAAELAIINSVQHGLASQLDFQAIIDLMGEKIRAVFDAQGINVILYDEKSGTTQDRYSVDDNVRILDRPAPVPLGKGFSSHIIQTRKPLVVNRDLPQKMAELGSYWIQTDENEGTRNSRAYLGAPIVVGDKATGVISLHNYEHEDAFAESDVSLLSTLAASLGVALENARLFDETQRLFKAEQQRAAELAIINSVQEGLASKLDIRAVYQLVGEKVREIFKADTTYIVSYDALQDQVFSHYYVDQGQYGPPQSIPYGQGLYSRVIQTRQPLLIGTSQQGNELGASHIPSPGSQRDLNESGLYVPILLGSEVRGVVSVQSHDQNVYTENDVRLLGTLANSMSVALENARLFDETQRLLKETEQRAAELAIINSVQDGLASKLNMQAIYELVGDKIRGIFDTQSMFIAVFDHEAGTDTIPYDMENGQRNYPEPSALSKFEQYLIAARQSVLITQDSAARAAELGMQVIPGTGVPLSGMWVPLISGNIVRGMISIQNLQRERAYGEADLRLLQTVANSMSVALENARLFDETQRLLKETEQRASELAVINTVSEALVAETDLDAMIQLIGEQMRETFQADIVYVALADRSANLIRFPYQFGEEFTSLPFGVGLTSKIIESAQPLLINRDIEKRREELGTTRVGRQARSFLGVPIMAGRQAIGAISVQSTTQENAFDENHQRLLSTIAANAGAAIRNAQLHAETQRRAQEMATLAEIGNDIAATRELEPVLEKIASHAKQILSVRDIVIVLPEPTGEVFRAAVALGRYTEEMKAMTITAGTGITGHILQSGQAEIVNHPDLDPRVVHVPGTPEDEDAHECLMGAPLVSRGETIGGIIVWRDHSDGLFTDQELDFLVSVARQTAIAIESARLYLETQRRANEMSALAEVGREISSSLDPAFVLERIAERAKDLLAAETSAVYLLEPGGQYLQAITALGELAAEVKADVITLGQGIIGSLALEGRAEFINDTGQDARAVQIAGTQDNTREKLMVAPLLKGDDVIGMMAIWRTTEPFHEVDLNFLNGLARQASIALENARLFEEIKRQGQYLETLFSNIPVAIVTVDENAGVLSWSPAAEKLFGYTSQEALGRDVDSLVANAGAVHAEGQSFSRQSIGNQPVHSITKRTRKDGVLVDVDLSALPLPLPGGKTGIVAIYHDIGEIQRQRNYYESIVQNSPVAIVTVDERSNVVSWNPGAEQLFGYAREEAIGHNVDELVAASTELQAEAAGYNQQASTDELHVITQRTRKDGSRVEVELAGVPLSLPTGKSGLVAIYHDITELQRARQEAVAANEAKSAFLATMSHEIRTPMNAVIGMSGLLMDTELNQEQHDYAETIRNSGDTLLAIINDILDFSKIEAGKMELEHQPFDLRECVESALDLVAGRAVEKNLDLAYIIEDDVPFGIRGDVTRLRQILLNLLSNAVKFTAHGEVVLTVAADGGRRDSLRFSVRDTGIGIPKDRMGRLFESFSQADFSTTRRYGGTGLGLAISKRLAEMMGGTMWAESAGRERGSTFTFTVLAPTAQVAERKSARDLTGIQPALADKRVLIVDDNATNRRILMLQTGKWGMQPHETGSPRQALGWLKAGQAFDLAILDMQMPDMDGLMLAREIGGLKGGRELPIILLTSLGRREVGADELTFAAFLTKPLKPSALFDALAGIFVQHRAAPKAEAARAGIDFELAKKHPLRILLAEDNAVNQKLALRILEQMGYRADVAANGLEAIESVERQQYDVILMDVQMPEMDGLDATRSIRKLQALSQPRIVAMTANAMQGDREMCLAAGMDDYISKPIRVNELVDALRKSRPAASPKPPRRTAARKAAPAKTGRKTAAKARTKSKRK